MTDDGGAYDVIRRAALERVEARRLRPDRDLDAVRHEVRGAVDDYERDARLGVTLPLGDPGAMTARVVQALTDFGPLSELLARDDIEEVFVEGGRVSYLDTRGRLRGLTVPTTEEENRRIVDRLLASTDRHLSTKHPLVQARVLQGSARLTAAISPVADRLSATLRRYTVSDVTLDELVRRDALSEVAADFLGALVRLRSRIVVSGEPGAGKTTLLGALIAAVPPHHCVRGCEEIRELAVPLVHGAYYEVRPPGLDGTGEIDLRALVKFVLGMRPDRIVVGEVRGGEAFELTRAINAGCGFLCTVHANSASEALDALVNAALMAGENVTEPVVRRVFARSIDVVVHVERGAIGAATGREVREIVAVAPSLGDGFTCEPLFTRAAPGRPLEWTGALPPGLEARLDRVLPAGARLRDRLEPALRSA
ncbi:MAG TPA: ATPase, T2SS/T4P/T4SS family [Acidimicrobiia bacterium]|nr:ATPase, T2SS/T4P/T4SS family [Acidimicrobiia bacterium]